MTGAQIDRLAREVIEAGGMGRHFVHSTGHGVGLDIHEMPYISARGKTVVEDGMVFTIEPGLYFPGEFGIRIEDMVVMRRGRAEIL
jgi:Xaa-Pro aminopeptidase